LGSLSLDTAQNVCRGRNPVNRHTMGAGLRMA
jgi:hypothetical protein